MTINLHQRRAGSAPSVGPAMNFDGSTWPATIAHTSVNFSANLLSGLTLASSPLAVEYLAGESGILPIIGYAVVGAWCLRRMRPDATGRAGIEPSPAAARE